MNSIEKYVLEPLEQMCVSINKISSNPFEALRSGSDTTVPNVSELETDILERAIIKMTNVLALGAG